MTVAVAVLWRTQSHFQLVAWWSANLLISGLRLADWRKFQNHNELEFDEAKAWLRTVTIYIGIGGFIWGFGAWSFLSADDIGILVYFLLTLIAVANGGTISYAAHYPATIAFTLPITLLTAHKLYLLDGDYTNLLALTTLAFLAFTVAIGRNYASTVGAAITLDVQNTELLSEAQLQRNLAQRANEDKSRFFAAVSHDLRQPLYAMGLLLESLGERLAGATQKELHRDIEHTHQAMADMFSSLLEVSQLDSATVHINRQAIDLDQLLSSLAAEFRPSAQRKNLNLEVIDVDLWVDSDPILLARVVRNLLSNAIKFSSDGKVVIDAREEHGAVVIKVSDNGCGIAQSEQDKVFSEYVQLNNPERDRNNGVGLGLAVVKRLCELLDIPIELDSALNIGTTFTLRLATALPGTAQAQLEHPHSSVVGLHVVLIDDDREIRDALSLLLGDQGCVVSVAATARGAIDAMRLINRPADIVLSDFRLGEDMNGIEAVREVRAATDHELPAVIITGDTDPSTRQEIRQAGLRVFYKPLSNDRLLNAIAEAV